MAAVPERVERCSVENCVFTVIIEVAADLFLQLLFLLDILLQLVLQPVVPALQNVVLAFQLDFPELCCFSELHVGMDRHFYSPSRCPPPKNKVPDVWL